MDGFGTFVGFTVLPDWLAWDTFGEANGVADLEALRARLHARGGEHDIANGLALRTDMHRLLDRGYLTIDEDLKLVVGKRLRQDFANGRSYYAHHGQSLYLPAQPHLRPAPTALAWHREQVFLG